MDESEKLIALAYKADQLFTDLTCHVNYLIDMAEDFINLRCTDGSPKSKYLIEDLQSTFHPMAGIIRVLGDVLYTWRRNRPRLLSADGVDEKLIDLQAHIDSLTMFFDRENVVSFNFDRIQAFNCISLLRKINRRFD